MASLKEIATHGVTSGAQLIVEGGFVVASAMVHDNGWEEIHISPVLDNAESARQYSKILEDEALKKNRPDVLSLGVFKIQKVD